MRIKMKIYRGCVAAVTAATLAAGAFAHPQVVQQAPTSAPTSAPAPASSFDADRADILAMAGNFRVRFNMQESTRWVNDYTPLEPKTSGGHEVVRVIEDTGRRIVLQHLLVAEYEGQVHIIKHWRQDWEYEPARILAYADRNVWTWQDVPENERAGRWSQTVYQVDDSPRYAGWGRFEGHGGVRQWQSTPSWRPLARRDAVRNPVYDRYQGVNRHGIAPDGWVHWQDNVKLGLAGGRLRPIVQEYVLNSYTRFDGFNVAAADAYWTATQGFWAAIRAEWARIAETTEGIRIAEEAQTGTVISGRLLTIAGEIAAGSKTQEAAIAEALPLMRQATGAPVSGRP